MSDDDELVDVSYPWALLFLMSYSSAVTLALTWVMWTGRSFRPGPPSANVSPADAETVPKIVELGAGRSIAAALPAENLASLGKTVRIGDLEVTPLDIKSDTGGSGSFRSTPTTARREESRVVGPAAAAQERLQDREFAPLERRFRSRARHGALIGSTIVTSQTERASISFPWQWRANGRSRDSRSPRSNPVRPWKP